MEITIPKSLEALVRRKVDEGHYSTEDEVVADASSAMVMLTFTPGGQERTEGEYAALFGKAGLKLTRMVSTASPVSVIEAEPA